MDVQRSVHEWQTYITNSSVGVSNITDEAEASSSSLPVGFVSVHTDAVVFLESQEATFGLIIHDNHGEEYVAAKSGHSRCLLAPHIAKEVAIKEALSSD